MPDENFEQEEEIKKIQKMKADAFELRALLDKMQQQGTQLAEAYNKIVNDIVKAEEDFKKIEAK